MATTTRVLTAAVSGTVYTTNANDALEAIDTCHSGTTAPTDELVEGKLWMDTTASPGTLKVYSASAWQELGGGGLYQSIASTDVTTPVATVEFDLDTTTYKEFLLRTREGIIASDGQNLLIQVSPDAGVTWRTTGYAGYCSVTSNYYTSTVGLWIGAVLDNGTAGGGTNMDTIIYNAGDSGKFTGTSTTGTVYHYTAGNLFQGGGSAYATTETHDKMRVITSSGNITSGTFELMGELI